MTQKELITWFRYIKAINKPQTHDNYMENEDKQELIYLNHRVMEMAHDVHNKNMLNSL
jgi:hypothetical protein